MTLLLFTAWGNTILLLLFGRVTAITEPDLTANPPADPWHRLPAKGKHCTASVHTNGPLGFPVSVILTAIQIYEVN